MQRIFNPDDSSQDLGPRGQTPLRLIMTPPPKVHRADATLESPHADDVKPVKKESRSTFIALRRDTIIRMLLGSPAHAFVFVTFTEFSETDMAMQDNLRDEERNGGFGDSDNDETFQSSPPPIRKIISNEPPQAPPPTPPVQASSRRVGFPYRIVLLGLPMVMLLFAVYILFSWRHSPNQPLQVIQTSPNSSTSPTKTAGALPPVVDNQLPPTSTPSTSAAIPAPATAPPQAIAETKNKIETQPKEIISTSATGKYQLQIVATPSRTEAERRVAALNASGAQAFIKAIERDGMTMYRVRIGGFANESDARAAGTKLGLKSMWIEKNGER